MPFAPGDNLCICDLSGKKVLMSETVKTWDGLRVWKPLWYPKHPQLFVRAIPDRMAVPDGRARPADIFAVLPYGYGTFCLASPDGTLWTFYVTDDGALLPANVEYGNPTRYLYTGGYRLFVDNDGALHVEAVSGPTSQFWKMRSAGGFVFDLVPDTDLALIVTASSWYA